MAPEPAREAWQRGPMDGIPPLLMPVAHALTQALEDLERLGQDLPPAALWMRPAGAASFGFHLQHVAGATDRLFTYARGERLDEEQRKALAAETDAAAPRPDVETLLSTLKDSVTRALRQLRDTREDTLLQARTIGRAALPTTTVGLLFHAAEHAMRHVGQAIVTARVARAISPGSPASTGSQA